MRILRAAEYRSMPWKNGGGVTTEIAISPVGAGLDDFDWRVSTARVEGGGPFSQFAGVDRTLAVLDGEGLVLELADRPPSEVSSASAPLFFPADVPTQASLIAGPITDLNVMTRRGRMTHVVERLAILTPLEIRAEADTTLVLCVEGNVKVSGDGQARIGPLDALLLEPGAPGLRLEPARTATLFVIRIDRVAG
jgi:environmental stress-induced protein Ves